MRDAQPVFSGDLWTQKPAITRVWNHARKVDSKDELSSVIPNRLVAMINRWLTLDAMQPLMKQPGPIAPRLIRFRDAPFYLGMDRNRFNAEVRPYLVEIRIGQQGIAFDRLDLDAWVDHYKSRNGRSGQLRGELTWDAKEQLDSASAMESGTSTNRSEASAFAKALEKATSQRRKSTSRRKRRKSGKRSSTV